MKNIIVGIDFSSCSLNAMKHAVSLAVNLKANLTLVYCLTPDAKIIEETSTTLKSNILSIAEKKLDEYTNYCQKYIHHTKVKNKIRVGKAAKEMSLEVEEQKNALVVIGTHGTSGFEELFIGSTAMRIISMCDCPVLTIRDSVSSHRDLTDMVLIIDSSMETLQKVKAAAVLAKAFQAKVHLIGLYTSRYRNLRQLVNGYLNRAEIYLNKRDIRIASSFIESDKDPKQIVKIAEDLKANIILSMKETDVYGGDGLSMTSFSQKLVNISSIPVLTINVDTSIYDKTQ